MKKAAATIVVILVICFILAGLASLGSPKQPMLIPAGIARPEKQRAAKVTPDMQAEHAALNTIPTVDQLKH